MEICSMFVWTWSDCVSVVLKIKLDFQIIALNFAPSISLLTTSTIFTNVIVAHLPAQVYFYLKMRYGRKIISIY